MAVPALNNRAYFSTTGAQLVYWCPVNSDAYTNALSQNYSGMAYLGTTVKAPEIDSPTANEKVMNSLTGTMVQAEKSFQGLTTTVVMPMNHVSESSLRRLKALPYSYGNGSTASIPDAGKYTFQDLGSLSNQDGAAVMLVLLNSMAPALAGGVPDLPLGIRFFCATLEDSKQTDLTTVPKVDTLVFEANIRRGSFYTLTANSYWDMQYLAYDYEVLNQNTFTAPS